MKRKETGQPDPTAVPAGTGAGADPPVGSGRPERTYTSFAGQRRLVTGELRTMLARTKKYLDGGGSEGVLIFEDLSGRQIDFDFRGSLQEVTARLASHPLFAEAQPAAARSGPGRPRLGVVCREVSLMPRQWEWLEEQPGGISAALRKLVEDARRNPSEAELLRRRREAASRFLWVMAGNLPNFEEATRALFAGDRARMRELMLAWPADIRDHAHRLLG